MPYTIDTAIALSYSWAKYPFDWPNVYFVVMPAHDGESHESYCVHIDTFFMDIFLRMLAIYIHFSNSTCLKLVHSLIEPFLFGLLVVVSSAE